jgi:hypothetical protein
MGHPDMVFASLILFGLLLWLLPAFGVYVHASNRNRDALLWTIVTLVAGLVGVLLYVLLAGNGSVSVQGSAGNQLHCPDCNQQNPAGSEYCGNCGNQLWADCTNCGQRTPRSNQYCPNCGAQIGRY